MSKKLEDSPLQKMPPYVAFEALTARRRHAYLCPKIAVVRYRYDAFLYHLQRREKTQNAAVNHKLETPLAKQKFRFIPKIKRFISEQQLQR